MPKTKASKRKVRAVKEPNGDEGKDLALADKREKLDNFLEQYNFEVEQRLNDLDKCCQTICKHIEAKGQAVISSLSQQEANMPFQKYLESFMHKSLKDDSFNEILELDVFLPEKSASRQQSQRKRAKYGTPACRNANRGTMWTATPKETPLLDKRLLNVSAQGKPHGLSLYASDGKMVDRNTITKMKAEERKQMITNLKEWIDVLQSSS